jgi:nicotinic acid mononucleotide adenylyltransferase
METPTRTPKRGLSFDDFGTPVRGLNFEDDETPKKLPSSSASAHPQTPDRDIDRDLLAPVFSVTPEKDLLLPDFESPPKKSKIMKHERPRISTGFYPPSIDLAGKNIILVFHGSYNPVHKGHIQLCKEAMKICADRGLNVTRKIFSVASDETIRLKINKKASTNPGENREVLFDCKTREDMISNALKEEQINGVEIICHKEDNDRYTLVSKAIHRKANDIIVMVGGSDWVDDKPDIIKNGICNSAKQCFPALIIARDESNSMSSTELQKCLEKEKEFCKLSYKSVYDLVNLKEGRVAKEGGGGDERWNKNKIMYVRLKNSC